MSTLAPLPNLAGLQSAGSTAASAASAVASTAATVATGGLLGSGNLTKYVMILLGLLLIAAGIFSFDKTRELVVSATKTASEGAAAVA